MTVSRRIGACLCALLLCSSPAFAGQTIDTGGAGALQSPPQPPERACDACPVRSVGKSIWQTTVINVFYGLANLIRGQVTAKVTPKTWWDNMENGWVWDLDDFVVNQIGHPYQGNNYFNAARSNGLSFYESAAITAFGSATWEYFGETNKASLNDFINTTLGGIALGEMFHRTAWLVRDTRATGKKRLWNEIGALALDPITGLNRFLTGDASRVVDKPAAFVPTTLRGRLTAGALWRGSNTKVVDAAADPFFEADLVYGDPTTGRSRTPYDAFSVRLTFGGGSPLSEARVRGRLMGNPVGSRTQFSVIQSYSFLANDAFHFGAQSLEGSVGFRASPSEKTSLAILGWGGFTILGAVDSLPLGLEEPPEPEEEEEGDAGQGVSEGPRFYDYGPGSTFGVSALFSRNGQVLAAVAYEGRSLFSLDGVRANHVLQRLRLDLTVPVKGRFGLGATGEFFDRRSYYQDADRTVRKFHYPQFRFYFLWRLS